MGDVLSNDQTGKYASRRARRFLPVVLAASLIANVIGNGWGAPSLWHPDELIVRSEALVRDRTLDPHFFAYGGLQHYVVAVFGVIPAHLLTRLIDPKPLAATNSITRLAWEERVQSRTIRAARFDSAVLAAVVTALAFVVADFLFDSTAGMLAAVLLAVAPSWVLLAHFATVDVGATAWFWLACAASLVWWRRGRAGWLIIAGLLAGAAGGAKIDRILAIVPVAVAGLAAPWPHRTRLVLLALFVGAPLGFVAANPMLALAPLEYLTGFTRDLFFNLRRPPKPTLGVPILGVAWRQLGATFCSLLIFGAATGCVTLARQGKRAQLLWILSAIVPTAVVYLGKAMQPWYVPFFLPPIAILAGIGLVHLMRAADVRVARVTVAIAVVGIAAGAIRAARIVALMTHESRDEAVDWILRHVPDGSRIDIVGHDLPFPPGRYAVRSIRNARSCGALIAQQTGLDADSTYRSVRDLEAQFERLINGGREPQTRRTQYQAWFDYAVQSCREATASGPGTADRRQAIADYVVVVDHASAPGYDFAAGAVPKYRTVLDIGWPSGFDSYSLMFVGQPVTIYGHGD